MAILKIRDNDGKITEIPALKGEPGVAGKSAYEYAKDGGYTGTAEEFAKKLATEVIEHNVAPDSHQDIRSFIRMCALKSEFEKTVHFTADEFFYLYVERVWDGTLEFYNGTTWVAITANDPEYDGKRIPAVRYPWGYTVYVRGKNNTTITKNGVEQWKFLKEPTGHDNDDIIHLYPNANLYPDFTGEVYGGGNVKYLLDYEIDDRPADSEPIALQDGCFAWMFYNYSYQEKPVPYKLMSAPELPSAQEATVSAYCYQGMFCKCKHLTTPPALPDGAPGTGSYKSMFEESGVTRTPKFYDGENVPSFCYSSMFKKCLNLTIAEELPSRNVGEEGYSVMFSECSNLVTPPRIQAMALGNNACAWMFAHCSRLERAPALKEGQWLSWRCYKYMFENCTSLIGLPIINAFKISLESCLSMFEGCTAIKVSSSSNTEYIHPYTVTASHREESELTAMFANTFGNVTTPQLGTTYYLHSSNYVIPSEPEAASVEENSEVLE